MNRQKKIKKIVTYGIFISFALVASYIETLIPIPLGIPGAKIGLANGVTIVMLCLVGWKEASILSIFRVVLAGILFGNLFAIMYSLSGAILSLAFMILLKKMKFNLVTVSIVGGIAHNLGQLVFAFFVVENGRVFLYFPVLVLLGSIAGTCIGILGSILVKRLNCLNIRENFM